METLRNYLESMFKRYPDTPEAEKAKAELWQMMEDKFNELTAEGKKENEAVGIVIAEFGDLEEVADSLGISTMLQSYGTVATKSDVIVDNGPEVIDKEPAPQFAFSGTEGSYSTAGSENVVRYEEPEAVDDGNTINDPLKFAYSVFWPTVTCIYLCWSFLSFKWWMTWIIWPLAAILHSFLKRVVMGDISARDGRVYKNRIIAAVLDSYWLCVVFVYFVISFMTGAWHITWIIYLIAPFMRNLLKSMATEEGAVQHE